MSEQLKQPSQVPQQPLKTAEKTAAPKVYKKPEETLIGQEISGCIILEKVSEGGMGTVFKAKHKALDRIVCVKILSPALSEDKKAVGLFLTEARAIAEIDHPNIVFVYNVGREKGFYFIVMSFIEGESLSSIVRKRPNLPVSFVIETFMGILQGLEAAHQKGIIHRDIKPSNILINKKLEPKIVDFGIAKKVDKDKGHTKTTELAGTAYFLSPEQALGRPIDTRADLYSLGASLYYVLTAKYPFTGKNSMDIIQKHINEPVPDVLAIRKNIPPWLGLAVSKLMSKNPNDRFQTATEALNYFKKMRADDQLKVSGGVNITEEVGLKVNLREQYATPATRAASERLSNNRFNMNVEGIAPSATKPGASNIVSLGDRSGGFSSESEGSQPSLVDNKQPDKTFTQKFIEQRKKQMTAASAFDLDPTTTLTKQKNKFLLTGFLYTVLAAAMLITAAVLFINLGAAGAAAVKVAGMPFAKAVVAPFMVDNFITQNMIMVSVAFVFLIFTLSMIFFDVVRKCVGIVLAISATAYILTLYGFIDPDNTFLNFAAATALPVYTLFFCALAINLDDCDMLPLTARFLSIVLFLAGFACIYAYTAPQYFASGPMTTSLLYAALGLSAATIVIVFIRGSIIFRFGAVLLALLSCLSVWLYQSSGNNYFLMQEIQGRIKLEEQAAPQPQPAVAEGQPPAAVAPQEASAPLALAPKIVLSGFTYAVDLLADDTPSVDGVPLVKEHPARRAPAAPKEEPKPIQQPVQPVQNTVAEEVFTEQPAALQPAPQQMASPNPVAEQEAKLEEEEAAKPKVILSPQERREQFITALAGQLSAKTKSQALAERQVWNFALREPYEKLIYSYKADNIAFLTVVLMVIYGILSFIISVLILREERWNLI